jgi:UDP-3-O-[3-hydroxymyristoyl] glucosamine N-acyltransferase
MRQKLADIATQVQGELIGDGSCIIESVAPLDEADTGSISVLINARHSRRLESTRATAVIVSREIDQAPVPIIRVASPEVALATLLSTYFVGHRPAEDGIHQTARIHPAADVDEEADVGPYVSIGPHTSVGRNARIGAGVAVGAHCRIGAGTWIFANTTLYDRVSLGEGVIIHSGTVIGSDGFGYFQGGSGARKIPQVGGVEIGDEVEIGANTTIDRATMGLTRIGRGTKIDNLVQIGHNVFIGDHVTICAQVGIAGSTVVEAGSLIGGQAGLSDHIQVGAGSRIGGQAGVTKSIPGGSTVSGYPARPHNQARRIEAAVKRLPDLLQQIQNLEARIKVLESQE